MKIRIKTMLGSTMSWSVVMRALATEMIKDHDLFLESINGLEMVSEELKGRVMPCFNADLDLAYTMPENFSSRFNSKSKIKAAIYNYESSLLPIPWRQNHRFVDLILPSSNYCKEVFCNSGYPEEKIRVVPHGINHSEFTGGAKCEDMDDKKFNFLNVSIPHYRKNLDKLIEAYYLEFDHDENVCLNIKTSIVRPKKYFEVNILDVISRVEKKFSKKLPEVKILTKRYNSMFELYNSCNAIISTTSSEGFGMPLLEGMASKKLIVCPIQTGQADFLNKNNCIEVEGRIIDAKKQHQYWRPSPGSKVFMPNIASIRASMRKAYSEDNENLILSGYKDSLGYSWSSAYKKLMELL